MFDHYYQQAESLPASAVQDALPMLSGLRDPEQEDPLETLLTQTQFEKYSSQRSSAAGVVFSSSIMIDE